MDLKKAKEVLKSNGYYVGSLWQIEDVTDQYECSNDEAQNVLDGVFNSDWVTEQIFFMIDEQCREKGILIKNK